MAAAVWALCAATFAAFYFSLAQRLNHTRQDRYSTIGSVAQAIVVTGAPLIWAGSREGGTTAALGWMLGWAVFIWIVLVGVGIWNAGTAMRRVSAWFSMIGSAAIVMAAYTM